MEILDSHTHLDKRGNTEFELLHKNGYTGAVVCAFYPVVPRSAETMLDLFDLILTRYTGEIGGLKMMPVLGVHPRSIPKNNLELLFNELPSYLQKDSVVGLGEVGLEFGGDVEEKVLKKQLEIAAELGKLVVLHTPRENKLEIFEQELKLAREVKIAPELVIVDHNDEETIAKALEAGHYAGLSINAGKLDAERAAGIITKHEAYSDRMLLNTDLGYRSPNILCLAQAVEKMSETLDEKLLKKVVHDNAAKLFNIQ